MIIDYGARKVEEIDAMLYDFERSHNLFLRDLAKYSPRHTATEIDNYKLSAKKKISTLPGWLTEGQRNFVSQEIDKMLMQLTEAIF